MYRPNAEGLPPSGRPLDVHDSSKGPSYYNVPMLKPPVWKWEIATYFWLGGMSAGAFILSRLAERFGGEEFREVTRFGSYAAIGAAIPCPILLIHDLGDRSRFHHMLRVWKPKSAMNLGTWVLTSYSPIAALAAGRELLRNHDHVAVVPRGKQWLAWRAERRVVQVAGPSTLNAVAGAIGVIADVAGVPLAFLLATYTGVLLANTATPVWAQNKWLSPLFAIGAMSTGASVIGLLMELAKKEGAPETRAEKALTHFSTVAHTAEAAAFGGYIASLKPAVRKPFTTGSMKHHTAFTFGALAVAETLKHLPLEGRAKKVAKVTGHLASLASALSMRWSVVFGAHESGNDPVAARATSKARDPQRYGWLREKGVNQPREKTAGIPDPKAISTIDPVLRINPNHR
jgi:formate-dependent nitrite reductase membrane component NrfD